MIGTRCSVDDCGDTVGAKSARGLCSAHYARLRRGLTIDAPIKRKPRGTVEERLLRKVVTGLSENECWEWNGQTDHAGYPVLGNEAGRRIGAHRISYMVFNGPIPDGMFVCHSCDNPTCCNPKHLFVGTHTDNMRDMSSKGRSDKQKRTHCPRGHEYNEENTYVNRTSRYCRACGREAGKRYRKSIKIGALL